MTDGLLEDIIQYEKRVKQQLAEEEQRVASWLEDELSAQEEALSAARQRTEAGDHEALEAARQEARQDADQLVQKTEDWCQRLQQLDDRTLLKVLEEHFDRIMPEPES